MSRLPECTTVHTVEINFESLVTDWIRKAYAFDDARVWLGAGTGGEYPLFMMQTGRAAEQVGMVRVDGSYVVLEIYDRHKTLFYPD